MSGWLFGILEIQIFFKLVFACVTGWSTKNVFNLRYMYSLQKYQYGSIILYQQNNSFCFQQIDIASIPKLNMQSDW